MEATIQPATAEDTPFLAKMLVLTMQTQPIFARRDAAMLETLALFEIMRWQPEKVFAFVARSGEENVGAVWLNGGGEIAGKTFTVGLAVVPEFQRQRVGTRLMEYALKFCAEQRAISIDLKVHPSNEKALKLYRKFGFKTGLLEMNKRLKG